MYLPSQEKALGIIQCLDILENSGELPTKQNGPLCLDAETWSAQRLLYHLGEFVEMEEPEFYESPGEQNNLLAEETLRELINRDNHLTEIYDILLGYSKELPSPRNYQVILPENKDYNSKIINPDKIPNIWKWQNCQLLFVSLDCCLRDPNGSKIKATIATIEENNGTRPEGIVLYNYDKKNKKGLLVLDDVWYNIPEPYQLKGLGWIGRNHMYVEQCIEIMEKIRGENQYSNLSNITVS